MAGDDYTLHQAALLLGIRFGSSRHYPALLERDEETWSSGQHGDATYWNELSTKKPFRGLSSDVCRQQTEFLTRTLQAHLQSQASQQGSANVLETHPVTREQNMALLFHRFDMRGPNPFRHKDYSAITKLLSKSQLFRNKIGEVQLAMWMLELKPYFSLLVRYTTNYSK